MDVRFLGNNPVAATELVQSLVPPNTVLTTIDSGYDNLVIIADEKLYRFPRSGEVWERGLSEWTVLKKLSATDLPVPRLISVHDAPAYAVLSSLPGTNRTSEMIRTLPTDIQRHIGEQIGTFAYQFHSLFSPEDIRPLLADQDPQTTYAAYLDRTLGHPDTNAVYAQLATWVRTAWPSFEHPDDTVIHDDLHTHNLLFDDTYALTGVIDFGDISLGSPEQDLRYTYWLGDAVIEGVATAYEQHARRPLNLELLRLCAISQEITGLYDPKRSYMHDRARNNLAFRFPELVR